MSATRATAARATTGRTGPVRLTTPPVSVPAPPRPDLRVVPPAAFRAPRAPFALLVGTLLAGGLLSLLLLNTVLGQDALRLHALQRAHQSALDEEQQLAQQVAAAGAPEALARRAAALGMLPSVNPVFLRTADGRVLGVPGRPAAAHPTATPSSGPTAAPSGRPTAAPSGTPTPSGKPAATPSGKPAATPTGKPTGRPSGKPSGKPTATPTKPGATSARLPSPPVHH